MFRIIRSMLVALLLGLAASIAVADGPGAPAQARVAGPQSRSAIPYDSDATAAGQPVTTLLPDERDRPLRPLAVIAPGALIVALTALGLTITLRSLRHDMRQRRTAYRRRVRQSPESRV